MLEIEGFMSSYFHQNRIAAIRSALVEAIKGTQQDYTAMALKRAIFLLAVPMVLEMVMESIFALVDVYFVSRLGAEAVATVGLTESILTLIYAVASGLAVATAATVARRIGEKDYSRASNAAVQAIVVAFTIGLIIAIPGALFSSKILSLMGAESRIVDEFYPYMTIMLGGNAIIMLLFVINAVFRSSGDAAIAMRVLWFANIVNCILDPVLIFGLGPFPELGIKGAAIATNTGRGLAVIYQLYLLTKGNGRVRIKRENLKPDFKVMLGIIRISLGGIGQSMIATSSWIGMVRIIAAFGSEVLAGYTIAIRILVFSMLPSWGLSNASATLVGQNLGAGQPDNAEKAVWVAGIINIVVLGLVAIAFISLPDWFVKFFDRTDSVVKNGSVCLRVISYGLISYAMGMVLVQAFNGAGDTKTPTWINLFCFWLLEIPLAYVLAIPLSFDEQGVYYAIVVADTCMTLAGLYLFRKGKWKLKQV